MALEASNAPYAIHTLSHTTVLYVPFHLQQQRATLGLTRSLTHSLCLSRAKTISTCYLHTYNIVVALRLMLFDHAR